MRSDNQIIDGIYKLCYNINIVCGANGRVAFLSSKAKQPESVLYNYRIQVVFLLLKYIQTYKFGS